MWAAVTSAIILVAMSAVVAFAPTGFISRQPSEPVDLLQTEGTTDQSAVVLGGAYAQPSSGTVLMPTLSQTSPDRTITLAELIVGYVSTHQGVLPRASVYPPGQTIDETQSAAATEAEAERTSATVAALREASVTVTPMPQVASIRQSGPAYGRLEVGDFISAVDGKPVTTKGELTAAVQAKSVGAPIAFTVVRAGQTLQIPMNLVGSSTDGKVPTSGITPVDGYISLAGVYIDPTLAQPGGSQGLSLALAVYAWAADEDILRGRTISAAGTMSLEGKIGKVPGISELAQSANLGGAEVFVVPWESCVDLVGDYGDMRIVPASTLAHALWALRLESQDSLPTCPPR
jgi:PDZ domain-containing protein